MLLFRITSLSNSASHPMNELFLLRQLLLLLSLFCALLLDIAPLPAFMELGRPLWLALILSFWALYLPRNVGFVSALLLGLAEDVLLGTLFGLHAWVLLWIVFCIRLLDRRLRLCLLWEQSLWLLLICASAQLIRLWLGVLSGSRPDLLAFLLPALVSAVLWPWVFFLLRSVQRWFNLLQ